MSVQNRFLIGADFGTDSVRCVIIDAATGNTVSCSVAAYPRWNAGKYQHPRQAIFRQHPLDYLEAFEDSVLEALRLAGKDIASLICAIGIDTTGSTPCPVDKAGTPLALGKKYTENENAMFFLWKDHSADAEALTINKVLSCGKVNYCRYMGKYSAEWYWAKILHAINVEPSLKKDAYMWVEHCDWMVAQLTGNTNPASMYHSACASGHKALWHSSWEGLPDKEILGKIDPYLAQVRDHYGRSPEPACVKTGVITKEWAQKLGIPENVVISGASFDAHAGAVGAGIREHTMVCTIGTSAVDMMIAQKDNPPGEALLNYGGQAEDSILPGYIGIETGQAAFGDILAWYKKQLMWPYEEMSERLGKRASLEIRDWFDNDFYEILQERASEVGVDFPVVLDWFNGRRYPDTDDRISSSIRGVTMGTSVPSGYKALVFGALSGLKRIVDGFVESGLQIRRIVAVGGIAKKSEYIMQMMADLLDREIITVDNDQTCALGAAISAAVASGCYSDMQTAIQNMSAKELKSYKPDLARHRDYMKKYEEYISLAEMVS